MLHFFRSFLGSKLGALVALAFLALIALAFASGDVANSGGFGGIAGGDRVATVGKDRIDSAALSQAATTALENLKEQNPRLSMQGFLASGGLNNVLDSLIDRAAIATFGREHGIVAGDRLVDSEITKLPAFLGPDGKFSERAFRQLLQQRGVSEKLVRDDLAQGLIARQILLPASFGATVPRESATRYAMLLTETRVGAIALLPSAAFVPKAPPTDAELTAFYTTHRNRFIRPERRVIRYATFDDSVLKNLPAPTGAEVTKFYDDNKARYAASESRRLTQLVVPTEAAAKAIAAEVAQGTTLEAAARSKGLSTANVGPVAKAALAGQSSQAVADAAFAAAQGQIATPSRSGLGWHVVRIDAIDRRPERALAQVQSEIVAELAAKKRRTALSDFSARIEEEFDNGANLADVAKERGLKIEQTQPLTADGRLYAKPSETAPPVLARAVASAFAMERENEPQIAEVEANNTFIVYDVTEIAPSAPAPLAEIKSDVTAAYMLVKGSAEAAAAARRIEVEVRKGADLAGAMAKAGRPLPPVEQVKMNRAQLTSRGQVPPPLGLLFSMAEGTVKVLAAPGDRGWFVVALKDIDPGKVAANNPIVAAAQRELGSVAGSEYAEQLRRAIRAQAGVKRNQVAIDAVRKQLGGGGN